MENDSQKAGRHRNDTRKDTRLHCSDFSALKNPTTYSNTRSSPLLHLENRSDHHVLLVVVELVHHLFCLLQELFQSVWQRMINSALNEMTISIFQDHCIDVYLALIFPQKASLLTLVPWMKPVYLVTFLLLGGTSSILRTFLGGTS